MPSDDYFAQKIESIRFDATFSDTVETATETALELARALNVELACVSFVVDGKTYHPELLAFESPRRGKGGKGRKGKK